MTASLGKFLSFLDPLSGIAGGIGKIIGDWRMGDAKREALERITKVACEIIGKIADTACRSAERFTSMAGDSIERITIVVYETMVSAGREFTAWNHLGRNVVKVTTCLFVSKVICYPNDSYSVDPQSPLCQVKYVVFTGVECGVIVAAGFLAVKSLNAMLPLEERPNVPEPINPATSAIKDALELHARNGDKISPEETALLKILPEDEQLKIIEKIISGTTNIGI